MDTVFDKLRAECLGHHFEPDNVARKVSCRNPEHVGEWDTKCWKASVARFFEENSSIALYENSAADHAQDIIGIIDPGAVLVKYLLIAEGLDAGGNRAMYSDGTSDLSVMDEHGLLEWAKTEVLRKQLGRG